MEIRNTKFSLEEIQNKHAIFLQRSELYKKYGFDQEELRKKILSHLSKDNNSILEIGTGNGHLTTLLARSFDRIVSVDMDGDAQRIAGLNVAYYKQLDKIKFISADAGKLDYPDKAFDAVVSAFTFHHLDLPFKVIREMIRLAAKQTVISDFTAKGFAAVEKVHKHDGKIHEIKSTDFDIVGVYLKDFNFDLYVFKDEYQIIYSALRK